MADADVCDAPMVSLVSAIRTESSDQETVMPVSFGSEASVGFTPEGVQLPTLDQSRFGYSETLEKDRSPDHVLFRSIRDLVTF